MMKTIFFDMYNLILLFIMNIPLFLNFFLMIMLLIPLKYYNFHPMKFLTILIFLIFLISLEMNILFKSWMMFMFPLMMIGGLMIIFMYITSLTNNNLFKINYNNMMLNFIKFLLTIMFFIMIFFTYSSNLNNQELWNLNLNNFEENNEMKLNELFNFNKFSLMFMMLYLYFALIVIMNICYKLKSPLRQMYFYE